MQYEPVKQTLGRLFGHKLYTRKLFYRLLDILLLRTWHIHKSLKNFARSRKGKSLRVLDAGSGFGQYSYYMARKFPDWHVTGIDIKQEETEACSQFFRQAKIPNARFQQQDLTAFETPDTYDLILSVDVMEHIEDDKKVFFNFYRSLKQDGMLLISTPSDKGGSDVHHDDDKSFIEEHVRDGYAAEEIKEKLTEAGFSPVETGYTYGWPGSISWRMSMKYPILMLGRSKAFLLILPFYYLVTMPFILVLNMADVHLKHRSGTGLQVKAWKPYNAS
ncbi:MAG: class I SAM-dependent methyltransferase [Bacteroidales bacterium]